MSPRQLTEHDPQNPEHAYAPSFKLTDEVICAVESAPRGEAESYGATPYDLAFNRKPQRRILEGLQELLSNIPEDLPLVIASYVQDTFKARFWNRLHANSENFTTGLVCSKPEKIDDRLYGMIDKGSDGNASPAELLLLRDQLGIRSLELACLTHPYGGERIKILPEMQESVRTAVELLDGEYTKAPEPRYSVKDIVYDEEGNAAGLLMTRKRDFGHMKDGTIVRERSSFVLRVDEKSDLNLLIGAEMIEKLVSIHEIPKEDAQVYMEEFNDIISDYLSLDEFSQAIPIATTTYAFNRETTALVEAAQSTIGTIEPDETHVGYEVEYREPSEFQQKVEMITQGYQHEIYKSKNPPWVNGL